MRSFSRLVAFAVVLCLKFVGSLFSQMQSFGRLDGEVLPIVGYDELHLDVLKGGKKRQTSDMTCYIRPGAAFADGFVEVTDINADLDPLRHASSAERTKPGVIRFRFSANLVADRPLANCYALLSFITEGSVGTKLVQLGRLAAGKPKAMNVELRLQVDSVCSVHVFTNALEVKSTQHRDS